MIKGNIVNKRWNLSEMRIRVNNLRKVIDTFLVEFYFHESLKKTDNELDALYLTYYKLKDVKLKYNRGAYGTVKTVDYTPNNMWESYVRGYYLPTSTFTPSYASTTNYIYNASTTNYITIHTSNCI